MDGPTQNVRRSFFQRYQVWLCAALMAAVLVAVLNFHRDDSPKLPAATSTITGWKQVASSPLGRMETQGAAVDGKLYLIGGYYETYPKYTGTTRCDYYNPSTNTWTRVADMPHAVTHAGVATDGRFIYVVGGYPLRSDGWQNFASTNTYIYDTVSNAWSDGVPLPAARGAGSMVYLNGALHFISGVNFNRGDEANHWVFNLATRVWTSAAPLPIPRNHTAAIVLNGKIYVAGGQSGINDALPAATLFIYDPGTNKWSSGPNMPKPRSHNSGAAFAFEGRVVVAGGETTNGLALADVIAYDPTLKQWLALPSLPSPRHSPLVQPIGNTVIATDGSNPPTIETTTWISVGN